MNDKQAPDISKENFEIFKRLDSLEILLKLLLDQLVEDKVINLNSLNEKLRSYNPTYLESHLYFGNTIGEA